MTTLKRLLDYAHGRVFDKDPHAVLAMRLQHPDGCAWAVAEGVLSVTVRGVRREYPLLGTTLGGLAAKLQADGLTVVSLNPDVAGLAALTLVESAGDQDKSNGDHLLAYTSLLWVLQGAYAPELRHQRYQIGEALRQMVMTQSENEWLDLWGTLYGVSRPPAGDTGIPTDSQPRPDGAASDDEYSQYIPEEAFRLRVNPVAIENTIKRKTGLDVRLYEPWKDLFYLSESKLDHHRMYDGDFWSPHVFRPEISSYHNVKWDKIKAIIERDRPAGVIMYDPQWYPDVRWLFVNADTEQGTIVPATTNLLQARYNDRNLLDYSRLGDPVVENYRFIPYQLWAGTNFGQVNGEVQNPESLRHRRSFVRAQIVLSDMDEPLGHERARFPRVTRISTKRLILGDPEFRLSDYDPEIIEVAVEDVERIFTFMGMDTHIRNVAANGVIRYGERVLYGRLNSVTDLSSGLILSGEAPTLNYAVLRPVVTVFSLNPVLFADPRIGLHRIGERILNAVVDPPVEQLIGLPDYVRSVHSHYDTSEAGTAVLSFGLSVFPARLYSETRVTGRYKWTGGWDSRRWHGNTFINVVTEYR